MIISKMFKLFLKSILFIFNNLILNVFANEDFNEWLLNFKKEQ